VTLAPTSTQLSTRPFDHPVNLPPSTPGASERAVKYLIVTRLVVGKESGTKQCAISR
jgi:hypothetical protein